MTEKELHIPEDFSFLASDFGSALKLAEFLLPYLATAEERNLLKQQILD